MAGAFDYRVDWRPLNRHPGEHPAATAGEGGAFRGERLLSEAGQFRRLAIGASLRDPLARWWVQETQQRAAIDVFLCLDVSASMWLGGEAGPLGLSASLIESTAVATQRIGDRLGLVVAASQIDPRLSARAGPAPLRLVATAVRLRRLAHRSQRPAPARGRRSAAGVVEAAGLQPEAPGAGSLDSVAGLLDAHRWLPTRRSLVLVASDYLGPPPLWDEIFQSLEGHQRVPVVIEAAGGKPAWPRWGLLRVEDPEGGPSRVLWMRPSLARRIEAARREHDEALDAVFRRHRLRPLHLGPAFDPRRLSAYFHAPAHRRRGATSQDATSQGVTGRDVTGQDVTGQDVARQSGALATSR